MEPHERPAYAALGMGGLLGVGGVVVGLLALTWGSSAGEGGGLGAGLAGAMVLLGVVLAVALVLAGLVVAGVGWWALETGRTTLPSATLGLTVGFVGPMVLSVAVPSLFVLTPLTAVAGGALGYWLAPASPGSGSG